MPENRIDPLFDCAHCGRRFTKGWSDEEALAEAQAHDLIVDDDLAMLCDDCYAEFRKWWDAQR